MPDIRELAIEIALAARAEVCAEERFDQFAFGELLRIDHWLRGIAAYPPKMLPQQSVYTVKSWEEIHERKNA